MRKPTSQSKRWAARNTSATITAATVELILLLSFGLQGKTSASEAAETADAPIGASARDQDAYLGKLYGGLSTLPRKKLIFRFDQGCDPCAHYVLNVSGIKNNGVAIELPPVTFEPRKEWRPIPFD